MLKAHVKGYMERKCVICGQYYRVYDEPGRGKKHQCPKVVLAGIAAAERHAANIDDPTMPNIPACLDERRLTYGDRLAVGFAMMDGAA